MHTCELAIYRNNTSTRPDRMVNGLEWPNLMRKLAPINGPVLCVDKQNLPYFTPGMLRDDVPLSGKTLERARERGEPEVGAMRSAAHMTDTTFIIFDFDGLTQAQLKAIGSQVLGRGRAGLMYTTHSFGRVDKPGIRVRLILPVDLRLDANAYRIAHEAMNAGLFSGLADRTGKSMCQQQAMFGVHPERAHLAKCWRHEGAVFGLLEFLARHGGAAGTQTHLRSKAQQQATTLGITASGLTTLARLEQAVPHLYAGGYRDWSVGLQAFKALSPYLPTERLRQMAIRFGETSPIDSTRSQAAATDARYDAGQIFDSATPIMPPGAAAGVLLGMAKKRAIAVVETSRGCRTATAEAKAAALYLAAHHRRTWNELTEKPGGIR
jgi:cation transport regulator ChaC